MKIQIVHLEAHDDVISTRDKMGWGQTSRILLIWPPRGTILDRPLDLILLQRHSLAMGAQLSLVTRDELICFHAERLGIPTFPTLRKAQSPRRGLSAGGRRQRLRRSLWAQKLHPRQPRSQAELLAIREQARPQPSAWSTHPATRWSAFTLSVLAVLALLVMFVPGASIQLQPRQEIQSLILPITASVDYDLPKLTGEVPAHWVSIIVEARDSISATGRVMIPENFATGTVRFTNLTSEAIEIPEGTVVQTLGLEPVRFATTQKGKVAAGVGRYQEIPVRALSPGAQGNLAARSLQLVEGNLGLKASCTNPSPLRGGSDLPVISPSDADRKKLFTKLSNDLQTTAQQELKTPNRSILSEGDFAILPILRFVQVLEQKYQPEEGLPADQLDLTLRLEFQALVVSAQDLQSVVEPVLTASLPEGYEALPGTLKIEPVRAPVMAGTATARWQAHAEQTIQAIIPAEAVLQAIRRLPAEQAPEHLYDTFPLEQQPLIQLFPRWWPYLPFTSIRIEVN